MQQFSFNMSTFVILQFTLTLYGVVTSRSYFLYNHPNLSLLVFFIISVCISIYFIIIDTVKNEGFRCFMSHDDAFYQILFMINGLYFICLVITIVYNYLIVRSFYGMNKLRPFMYLPFLQLLFCPVIIFNTAFYFYEDNSKLHTWMMIGEILSCLNGIFNGLFFGFNETNRRKLVIMLGFKSGLDDKLI